MERSVTVQIIRAGQPRPYADSEYEAYLTFSTPESSLWASHLGWEQSQEETVRQYVKLFVHDFYENPEWYQPWLEKLEYLGEGKWHVKVISPYLD